MDLDELKVFLDSRFEPIVKAIDKLEEQQERVVNLVAEQLAMAKSVARIELDIKEEITRNERVHDELFKRMREYELSEGSKLWDVVKIIAASIFGSIIGGIVTWLTWLAGHR